MKMRKLIIALALLAGVSSAFAQADNVKKAKKEASSSEPNFQNAEALIEEALKNPATKNAAETWYVKGLIYSRMFEIEDDKRFEIPPRTPNIEIQTEGSYKAFVNWLVADSLDISESINDPKRKGKLKFRSDIKKKITPMFLYISNYGNTLFTKGDYAGAIEAYENFLKIPTLDLFKEIKDINLQDSAFIFAKENAALSLRMLYGQQVADKDTVAFLKSLQEGMDKYSENTFFLINMIDYNIHTGKEKEALENIEKAIKIDPNNYILHYVRGFIYSLKPETRDLAKSDFQKAIDIKNDYADAYAGFGFVLESEGTVFYEKSISTRNPQAADAERAKADELYKEAISYLEKARELNIKNDEVLLKLQSMYRKLKMYDKAKEIRAARGF